MSHVPDPTEAAAQAARLCDEIEKAVCGKRAIVRSAVEAFVSGGHVLIEDVPGVGKTTLARALAGACAATFQRVQFTSDLLPSDVIGGVLPEFRDGAMVGALRFSPGPIFAQIVLADEINRASPKTQSALLEAMAEGGVTVDGERHVLPDPFFVIATQNPFEHHGTYPLPESQLDRFQRRLELGHPEREDELAVLRGDTVVDVVDVSPVLSVEEILGLRSASERVKFDDAVLRYLLDIAAATRDRDDIAVGVSTRGALAHRASAQARALLDGRAYCIPEDVRETAQPVLAHRLILDSGQTSASHTRWLVEEILESIPVPL